MEVEEGALSTHWLKNTSSEPVALLATPREFCGLWLTAKSATAWHDYP